MRRSRRRYVASVPPSFTSTSISADGQNNEEFRELKERSRAR
jgi:hypothetical protein